MARPVAEAPRAAATQFQFKSPAEANSCLLKLVVERLASRLSDATEVRSEDLFQCCYFLARGIEVALLKNDIPLIAHALPSLVKQVYQHKDDTSLQSAIMVLMMTVKNACKNGWFIPADTDELLGMANELCSSFCTMANVTTEEGNVVNIIAKIISRFYPQFKLCGLVVSFEVKPGYDVLMADFHIQKNLPPEETIRLFVAQTDNLETSSCIISPPQVSFLVNGKGVERRTNFSLESGPQFPTDITKMLKYGTNIIQAVGYFSGNYIIAIAYTSKIALSNAPKLKDYVQPAVPSIVSDSEIIEGPSRVSLNCPISLRRIKTPVKGHLCKHHQCFDYDTYVEMNYRRPSWRCPFCNHHSSFRDLRIDQNMVKILGKVGTDIADVIIFNDGSWKVAVEQGGTVEQRVDNVESKSNRPSNTPADFMDLTIEGYEETEAAISSRHTESLSCSASNIDNDNHEMEDRKPIVHIQDLHFSGAASEPSLVDCAPDTLQACSYHMGGEMPSRNFSSATISFESSTISLPDFRTVGTLESIVPNAVLNPVITDAVSPVLNRQTISSLGVSEPSASFQHRSQVRQLPENMQLQWSYPDNAIIHAETERRLIPRHVNRAPTAIQALPVQSQISNLPQRTRTNVVTSSPLISGDSPSISERGISSVAAIPDGLNTLSPDMNMQQTSRNLPIASSALQLPAMLQVVGLPASNLLPTRAPPEQQRGAGAYRVQQQPFDLHYPHHQQTNLRTHQSLAQCANSIPESSLPSVVFQSQGAFGIAAGHLVNNPNHILAARQAAQAASLQTGAVEMHLSRNVPSSSTSNDFRLSFTEQLQNIVGRSRAVGRSDGFPELPSEQSWRPTGRMRGSLTGSAYSAALSHYLAGPTQQLPTRPSGVASVGASSSDQLPTYISSSSNAHGILPGLD